MQALEDAEALHALRCVLGGCACAVHNSDAELRCAMGKFAETWRRSTAAQRRTPLMRKFRTLMEGCAAPVVSILRGLAPCVEVVDVEAGTIGTMRLTTSPNCAARKNQKMAADAERVRCIVCCEHEREVAFGCSHMVACQSCAAQLQTCPICRAKITQRSTVRLS